MESSKDRDNDVYGLVGKLCESIYRSNRTITEDVQPYLVQENVDKQIRKLKTKAYEILLKKSPQDYSKDSKDCDPIVELLKHVFILKTQTGRYSQAAELQKYLDEFIDEGLEQDSDLYSSLKFLNCLKSVETHDKEDYLDVFHYDKPHPSLPQMYREKGSMQPYQIYPAESLRLPKQFNDLFKGDNHNFFGYDSVEPGKQLSLLGRFTINNKCCWTDNDANSNVTERTNNFSKGMNLQLNSYFLPQIKGVERPKELSEEEITKNMYLQPCTEGIVTEPESPWQAIDPVESFISPDRNNLTQICEINENEEKEKIVNIDKIWEKMDKTTPVTNRATWETLGLSEPLKELPFASETVEATIHLKNVAQEILFDQGALDYPDTKVPIKEFLKSIELLLLGLESEYFIYDYVSGFELKKGTVLEGISSDTLQNTCTEVTRWGTCFRNLSDLTSIDPLRGNLQIEGLIFKALCSSIKEFLEFYHSAVLKVSISENENKRLLNYLKKVRPLGNLILKVAQLCRCDMQRVTLLDKGIGILTHIYKEVTKVTEQNVAMVYYSILRECCEVYFSFLQQWIFEGECIDIYDEFMITARPSFVRTRGHRFWAKAFGINRKSVPGFLSDLTDSILQCGKTVKLLKICDPQNPLCRMSASMQPHVRVCLSIGMLREQVKFYEEYEARLEEEEMSLYKAIQQQKETEKRRAELVMAAQKDTLERLRNEREESLKKIAREKFELLEELKAQAQEAVQRKEKERDAELAADKLILEEIKKAEEIAERLEMLEREKNIKYYEELAEQAKKQESLAKWRLKRIKLVDDPESLGSLDKKVNIIADVNEIFLIEEVTQEDKEKESSVESRKKNGEKMESVNTKSINVPALIAQTEILEYLNRDENSNPTTSATDNSPFITKNGNHKKDDNQNVESLSDENQNCPCLSSESNQNGDTKRPTSTKAVRPTVLDITSINTQTYGNDMLDSLKNDKTKIDSSKFRETDNMTEAQRNKLKVLQQEYGFTPNNNESPAILFAMKNIEEQSELTEIQRNRLRNTQHTMPLSWIDMETKNSLVEVAERGNEEKTEIQMNRLRNTQHLTHLNWIETENSPMEVTEPGNEEKTEIQMNRLRNTQHLTDFNCNDDQVKKATPTKKILTEAEINRNKVMSHFYSRMDELEQPTRHLSAETLSDWQRNRNRNMAHSIEHYDFDVNRLTVIETQKETPMSTTTDHFATTASTHSDSVQTFHSCENTPISDYANHSDTTCARSSDGISILDEVASQRDDGSKSFQNTLWHPGFFSSSVLPNTPASDNHRQQLTAADVEMIDTTSLQVYLEKSVLVPLRAQSRLVNNAIIKNFLTKHNMLSHLHSLRSYFFLLNGEFAKTLTQSLFTLLYDISAPAELFNTSTLKDLLKKAIVSSLSGTYANSELLSLSAIEVPSHLHTSDPEVLDCLSLNYKMSWPLNIIFNDIMMNQYSRVFKFLLMVGRVLWVLQEDFHILKIASKTSATQNHHKLQLYRHSMLQFMNALHTYLTCSVLHASWSEFERELENAKTLNDIYQKHVRYIRKILARCMMVASSEQMRTCLCNIFKLVLKFHNRIRLQNWTDESKLGAGPNYQELEYMHLQFCEHRQYLAHLVEKSANRGYQPHLLQFLHALNINYHYDITAKRSSTGRKSTPFVENKN